MSSPSSTLDSVWARQRDRVAASRGQYVSRYTTNLNTQDRDLHTASGESKLDSSNYVATLSLADLTGTRMDTSSVERRTPRQTSPAPYTPPRSWNAAIFNKAASPAPAEPSSNVAAPAQPRISPSPPAPTLAPTAAAATSSDTGLLKTLNPYAQAWKPSSSSSPSSSYCQTNPWEQRTPPAQPEATSYPSDEPSQKNAADTEIFIPQQRLNAHVNQLPQQEQLEEQQHLNTYDSQPPREQNHWNTHDYQASQEQEYDAKKQPEQPEDQTQRLISSGGPKSSALRDISHRLQRNKDKPEESLEQRIERIRISNQAYMEKREIIEAERTNGFKNKADEPAAGNNSVKDPDEEIRREREANAARKLKATQLREWDAGKKWQ